MIEEEAMMADQASVAARHFRQVSLKGEPCWNASAQKWNTRHDRTWLVTSLTPQEKQQMHHNSLRWPKVLKSIMQHHLQKETGKRDLQPTARKTELACKHTKRRGRLPVQGSMQHGKTGVKKQNTGNYFPASDAINPSLLRYVRMYIYYKG